MQPILNMKTFKPFSFLVLICLSLACKWSPQPRLRDLIQPIVLHAGKADTLLVTDLFYSDDYFLDFQANPNLDVRYQLKTRRLILKADSSFEGGTLLEFSLKGEKYHILISSRKKQKYTFRFRPPSPPQRRMNLMGTFNDWHRNSLPMHDADGDGEYEITLELDPGQYLYQFVIDEHEIWDPENPQKVDNGFGSFNSVVSVPERHTDKAFLHVTGFRATAATTTLNFIYEKANQRAPLKANQVIVLLDNLALQDEQIQIVGNEIKIHLNAKDSVGEKTLRLLVTQNGQSTNLQTVRLQNGIPAGAQKGRFIWHDAIIYAVMPDRFFDGDTSNSHPVQHDSLDRKVNYQGGDLQGILDKLESGYFDSLGVNTLWIYPINQNTDEAFKEWPPPHRYYSAYHGYWPTHHEKVEERFGDLQLLQTLVAKAHEHGIKILLDFIANHVHRDHPFYQEHPDWFGVLELPDGRKNIRFWDEYRLTTWFEPFLPSFDYLGSDAALEAMTDNAVWWLQQTGADGFRHDAVKHVHNRFWRLLTQKIKREIEIPQNRSLFQIGETFGSYELIRSYVNNGQLNAQFNFNLYDTALYVFLNSEADFSILAKELEKAFRVFGFNHLMGNIMDSHDKVRYMAYADGDIRLNSSDAQEMGWRNPPRVSFAASYDKVKLYLAYLLTIPGVPAIYYGDEIGMTGATDPDNRRMMRFDDELNNLEKQMLKETRKIIQLRKQHSALRHGDFQSLFTNENCFVYLRSDMHERVLVVLNKSARPQKIDINLPEFYHIENALDTVTGEEYDIQQNILSLNLPAIGWKVLKMKL